MTASPLAYELFWQTAHLGDADWDAELMRFNGWEKTAGLIPMRAFDLPKKIYFNANFDFVKDSDYPVNDVNWPLMSKRMLETLLAVTDFPHRAFPVAMVDSAARRGKRFDESGNPLPGMADERFSAIQLLAYTDAFDWDESEYQQHKYLPDRTSMVTKLVVKEPAGGMPALFRLGASPGGLFVSGAGRQALEERGIRGVVFRSPEQVLL